MAVGNKYQLHILSRSQYDSLPKSSDYLYFVSESDGRINLYKGDVLVSNSFFIVPSLPSSGTLGKLYLNTGDGLVYYHSGSAWVKLAREVITSGLSGASTNDTVPSGRRKRDGHCRAGCAGFSGGGKGRGHFRKGRRRGGEVRRGVRKGLCHFREGGCGSREG